MFRDIGSYLLKYLWPPKLLSGLSFVLGEWHKSDAKDKTLLLLIFSPMMVCVLGLLFSIAGFVLFVLPSFVLKVLGWLLLIALFGAGGLFFYEKTQGKHSSGSTRYTNSAAYDVSSEKTDASASEKEPNAEENITNKWFKEVRNMKWPR